MAEYEDGNSGRVGDVCPIHGCEDKLVHRDGQSLVCEGRRHWVVALDTAEEDEKRRATRALVEQGFV